MEEGSQDVTLLLVLKRDWPIEEPFVHKKICIDQLPSHWGYVCHIIALPFVAQALLVGVHSNRPCPCPCPSLRLSVYYIRVGRKIEHHSLVDTEHQENQ